MPPPRHPRGQFLGLPQDPEGYYARLEVEPQSAPEAITAAYRRKARLLHPDVPVTGNAAAFVELKQAYDILIHTGRRAAYDRSARRELPQTQSQAQPQAPVKQADQEPGEIGAKPFPTMATPPTRHPRLRDLPIAVWVGMAAVLMIGGVEVGLHLTTSPVQTKRETIPATAPNVPPLSTTDSRPALYSPVPVHLAGTPNYYIMPAASAALLWHVDDARHTLVPWGQLPAFSSVQALRLLKPSGMVEIKVTDATNGYVEAGRLTPGDAAAAARAWCTYNAGPTPENGEVLSHTAMGHAALSVTNRTGQLAVVKVRSAVGAVVASVFLDPGGETTMDGLPDDPVQLDLATGEVWSRACRSFAAGMRAQRLPGLVSIGTDMQLAIPPDPKVKAVDLSDQAFQQE
jgi:DnaJ-like protein